MQDTRLDILSRDWSDEFVQRMMNRIVASRYKYGWMGESYLTGLADAMRSLDKRLALYRETGNTEWLIDAANFCMIEYMYPRHPNSHFRATDSEESPGLSGISAKEPMESER